MPGSAYAQKKPLDHDAYDSWQRVAQPKITPDGRIISWNVNEQEGDGTLYIKNLETGAELVIERGITLSMARDADWAVCTVKAPYAETRQARIEKKKKDEMPKDSLALINLKTLTFRMLDKSGSIAMGYDAAPYIAYTHEDKDKKSLLVLDTSTQAVDTIRGVDLFKFDKSGYKLAYTTKKDKKDSLSRSSVILRDFASGVTEVLSADMKEYAALTWNSGSDKLAFMGTNQEVKTDGTPRFSLFLSTQSIVRKAGRKTPAVTKIETKCLADSTAALPEGWVIGKTSAPRFSNSDSRIILSLKEYVPAKDTTVVEFESASLDIWVWDQQLLPPMHKAGAGKGSLTAVIDLRSGNHDVVTLNSNPNERISFGGGGENSYAVAIDGQPYIFESMWNDRKSDIYRIDLGTGQHTELLHGVTGSTILSPHGRYLAIFSPENGQWHSLDIQTGAFTDLTSQTGTAFWDEEDDHPMGYTPYSSPVWMGDNDEYAVIEDRYDVWRFASDGSSAYRYTRGREEGIQYRTRHLGRKSDPFLFQNFSCFPLKGDIYMTAFDENSKENGLGRISIKNLKSSAVSKFTDRFSFSGVDKAVDADRFFYLKGNFNEPMNLYVSDDPVSGAGSRLTEINPQQADYLWGDVQLVDWKAYDGTPLKGMLFTPENLDRSAKYPMMIYFYERNSETLYDYREPAPSRSIINIPFYVSRGYVVFVPDIVYTDGHPGESAYNCICAGAEAMCEQFPYIDRSRMAIQGQSWGGYQTAYLVTRTDMFAAAGAGAPVGNMTSAYGGIRWESGNSRISQYEHGQSRIGKTLWEEGGLDLYIENSPVFFAPNVKTPVLIMHNDADGAVPWYQGIEFFMSLRRLGKPAWLLEYNDEAHNLVERRNCKDLSIRLQQFFDHYLQGAPEPVWMKSGIPHERKGNYFATEYVSGQ